VEEIAAANSDRRGAHQLGWSAAHPSEPATETGMERPAVGIVV